MINKLLSAFSEVLLLQDQAGFRRGRFTIDDVFVLNQIIQKRGEFNLLMHLTFIDY